MAEAAVLIAALGLQPHPEGGWYRETWRADAVPGARASASAILFLLDRGQRSHWHRVDAAEIWLWHAGAPLALSRAADEASPAETLTLGPDPRAGHAPQIVIPSGHWQAAEARDGWTLVSCVVSPGFDFAGFTLAPPGWAPDMGAIAPAAKDEGVALLSVVPILRMFDEAKAREFYVDWLGFTVDFEHRFEADLPLYIGLSRAGVRLDLTEHHGDASPGSSIRIAIRGLRALHAELHARRYRYGRPGIARQPWGDEMTVHDPFGNRIHFHEQRAE